MHPWKPLRSIRATSDGRWARLPTVCTSGLVSMFRLVSRPGAGWVADEWRLTRARDVHEVLTWAEQRRGGRSYTLYAEAMPGFCPRSPPCCSLGGVGGPGGPSEGSLPARLSRTSSAEWPRRLKVLTGVTMPGW
jgi:hypothetical protein